MASLCILAFDPEGHPIQFDTWLNDLQLYLQSDSRDSVSLFDHTSGAAPAPPATADSAIRSQWLTRDAAARLAIYNHLPLAECAHFRQHRTAQALYDAVVARYSSPVTAAIGCLLLPYMFPELSTFATIEDLVSHLRTSDARYRAAAPAEGALPPPLPPPMPLLLLSSSLMLRTSGLLLLARSAAAVRARVAGMVAVAAGVVVGAAVEVVEAVEVLAAVGVVVGEGALVAAVEAAVGVAVVAAVGVVAVGLELSVERGASRGSGSCPYVIRTGDRASQICWKPHTQHRCFSHLDDAWHAEFGDKVKRPLWAELLGSGVPTLDLDYDAIHSAMYALCVSAEGYYYLCVPHNPGIDAAALGASESSLPCTVPAEALHTFMLDPGASRCFFCDSTALTPLPAPVPVRLADPSRGLDVAHSSIVLPCLAVPSGSLSGLHLPLFSTNLVSTAALQDAMVTTTTPGGQRVSICTCTRTGQHLATFTRQPGPSLYTLATEPSTVAASAQVSTSGHPSLPRLCGMHSRLLVSGLPRTLPLLLPSPAPPCLPCVKGRQCAAPHSSSFPSTTAPLQTLHMDVWGLERVSGQGRECYFLLVVDDYTRYTTVFTLCSKGQVVDVLILWIRGVRLQLRELFHQDLLVLCLHSDRGGEFSSDLFRDFCNGEGILQSFTLPDSPKKNGIAKRRIGLVMEVARTSMIHAAAPHFLWPFAVRYAAHQLNLWHSVSLPETSPTLRWTGKVGNASVFGVWGSRAFVNDTSADKLSSRSIPYVFLGFPSDAPGWQFYQPTSRHIFPSQDVTFDKLVPFYHLLPYRSAPPLPPPLFLAPGPPLVDPLLLQGPAPSGVSQVDPLPGTMPVEIAGDSDAARGTASEGAASGGAEPGGAKSEGAGSGGARSRGAGARGAGGTSAGGTVRLRPYFVPLVQQSGGLTKRREPTSHPVLPVRTARSAPRLRPPHVLGTHVMALCPSSIPLRVPLLPPLESSLSAVPEPESDLLRAANLPVSCLLTTAVTDPSFESTVGSTLVDELLDFAATCRLDYATALVAESESASPSSVGGECALGTDVLQDRQEDLEYIPTPRSYAEAITGPYSSQWQAAMDVEMASRRSTGTYVNAVPPSRANIVDGMWIFRGVHFFQTFPPTPKMTTLRVLLHVAAQHDYELHHLDFSTAFLHVSLHEIWLCRPPSFTGSFPAGTQWSLRWLVYGLCQAPHEWHDTLRTTLVALGFAPSTADPSKFLRTDTSLPPFYVLVYVDDLVFATSHTETLTLVKSELRKRHTCTDLGEVRSYLVLQITRDRARRTITLSQSHMVPQVLQRFGFHFSSPQPTPLSTGHSLSAPPSDKFVEPSGPYTELVGCLISSGMGLLLRGWGPAVLTGHADASWVDDSAAKRLSQGYTFSLGFGSVSWRSTCSSSILSSSCEAEIYAGAMAAQELRWLTYLLTDLGEQPRSPPVLVQVLYWAGLQPLLLSLLRRLLRQHLPLLLLLLLGVAPPLLSPAAFATAPSTTAVAPPLRSPAVAATAPIAAAVTPPLPSPAVAATAPTAATGAPPLLSLGGPTGQKIQPVLWTNRSFSPTGPLDQRSSRSNRSIGPMDKSVQPAHWTNGPVGPTGPLDQRTSRSNQPIGPTGKWSSRPIGSTCESVQPAHWTNGPVGPTGP
ncbi:unnamed protein product [Closterium sp. NIES-53]